MGLRYEEPFLLSHKILKVRPVYDKIYGSKRAKPLTLNQEFWAFGRLALQRFKFVGSELRRQPQSPLAAVLPAWLHLRCCCCCLQMPLHLTVDLG